MEEEKKKTSLKKKRRGLQRQVVERIKKSNREIPE